MQQIQDEIDRLTNGQNENVPKLPKVGGLVKDHRSPLRKVTDLFLDDDIPTIRKNIKTFIFKPLTKTFVKDLLIGSIEVAFSDKKPVGSVLNTASSLIRSTSSSGIPYHKMRSSSTSISVPIEQVASPKWPFDDLVFDISGAKKLKENLAAEILKNGSVSVYQLYDSISDGDDTKGLDYTNWYIGWTKDNFGDPKISRVSQGWWLQLPEPIQLEKK